MKRTKQYIGILIAIVTYYLIHEGAHLIYALWHGAFKGIRLMPLGVQVDVYRDRLTDVQLGHFCLTGAVATILISWILVVHSTVFLKWFGAKFGYFSPFKLACCWYTTIALLLIDPLYLTVLYRFVGGGDMNGILLLTSEPTANIVFAFLLIIHLIIIWKVLLPRYREAFRA